MDDTKTHILNVAEELMRRRGYFGFSYSDIESAVGIRKASIHHHFPTKERLAMSVVEAYGREYDGALARIEVQHTQAMARIKAYAELYRSGLHRGLGCLCAALTADNGTLPPQLLARVRAFFDAHLDWLARVIAQGQAQGDLAPAVDGMAAAKLLLSSLEGAMLLGLASNRLADFDDAIDVLWRLLSI